MLSKIKNNFFFNEDMNSYGYYFSGAAEICIASAQRPAYLASTNSTTTG